METGFTIAFICRGDDHSTMINYNKFGDKYWDDTPTNSSKIGYYFAYYFRQKYVYIHKITDILQPNQRPAEMKWESNRQILCLSNRIKEFTWEDWIHGIGFGAPYTPTYRMCQTSSWSYNHIIAKYPDFNFADFHTKMEFENKCARDTRDTRDLQRGAELIALRNSIQEKIYNLIKEKEIVDAEITSIFSVEL